MLFGSSPCSTAPVHCFQFSVIHPCCSQTAFLCPDRTQGPLDRHTLVWCWCVFFSPTARRLSLVGMTTLSGRSLHRPRVRWLGLYILSTIDTVWQYDANEQHLYRLATSGHRTERRKQMFEFFLIYVSGSVTCQCPNCWQALANSAGRVLRFCCCCCCLEPLGWFPRRWRRRRPSCFQRRGGCWGSP